MRNSSRAVACHVRGCILSEHRADEYATTYQSNHTSLCSRVDLRGALYAVFVTDVVEKFSHRADTTEDFPFLVTLNEE